MTKLPRDRSTALTTPRRVEEHPVAVYMASVGPGSRGTIRYTLNKIAQNLGGHDAFALDWSKMRFQHVTALRSLWVEHYAGSTTNKMLSFLRGVARAAWQLGQLGGDDYQRIKDVRGVRGTRVPPGRHLSASELRALIGVARRDPRPSGARDAAIIALLYSGGLRRSEVAGLDLADIQQDMATILVRGKGDKERLAYLAEGAVEALGNWLQQRGSYAGPLFWPIRRGGQMAPRRLSPVAIHNAVKRRAAEASLAPVTCHDFRRTLIGDLLTAGVDLLTVQHIVGHASPVTTSQYDRRPEQVRREAIQKLHVPY